MLSVATELINLEQTDFSGGLVTDANPLQFPANATLDESNFTIEKDQSRRRRKGLKLEADQNGNIYTPDSEFYKSARVTSKVYSTISPNATVESVYTTRKKDVVTLTDIREGTGTGGTIKSFDAEDPTLPEIPHSQVNGNSPYVVTRHIVNQAYVSVSNNDYLISLIYGRSNANVLGVTNAATITYNDGSSGQPINQQDARVADILSWSGRMVYCFNSGDNSAGYGIGISALPDPTKSAQAQVNVLAKCEQIGNELLATDGAFIYAGDLGSIIAVRAFRTGLLFFTSDNIWYLSAPSGYFDPYDFNFDKLAATRVSGKESIVQTDNVTYFWAESGIYVIFPDENTGFPVLQNITANRIEQFYESLLPETKANARGVYNSRRNEVRWLYDNDPTSFDRANRLRFSQELVYNIPIGAWSKNSYCQNDSTYIIDFIPDRAASESFDEAYVVDSNGDNIVVGNDLVYVDFLTGFRLTSSFKYVVRDQDVGVNTQARLASLTDESFLDFVASEGYPDGCDSHAYMKTGWFTLADTQRKKVPTYLTTTFERTESGFTEDYDFLTPSGCQLTTYWDYADDNYSGKKNGPYPVYRLKRVYMPEAFEFDYGQTFVSTKNKIRGRGKTMQFLFESEEGKDCRLYSWGFTGKILTRV